MFLALGFAILALSAAASASVTPASRKLRVHEHLAVPPAGFIPVARAPADSPLRLRLGLKQRDSDGLIKALYRVSDPASADYGKHLSQEEVAAFTGPTPETVSAVTAWLADNGVSASPASVAGDWLEFTIPAAAADALFDAEFTVFEHAANGGSRGIRTLKYSLPAVIQPHIDVLVPGISFWNPERAAGVPMFTEVKPVEDLEKRADCIFGMTPACLQDLYGIPTEIAPYSTSTLAVSGFLNEYANQEDLTIFFKKYRREAVNRTFSTQVLDGGINSQDPAKAGSEASLDIQYTSGIALGVSVTFISVGPDATDELNGNIDLINYLAAQVPNQAQVLTTSYGYNENVISPALAERLCTAIAALGTQGTSVIFASGDGGVAGVRLRACDTFVPTFPSGCPFLTAVGGTSYGQPEVAAHLSSGGFSNIFSIPDYQANAVRGYKAQIGDLYAGRYNTSGRGFPDVSAVAEDYKIIVNYRDEKVSGTSASAPVFASMISIINSRLLAQGKPVLGFLNPQLYAHPEAFNDITSGSNPGCGTIGFPAKTGWDPVTGLGSPNFAALAAVAGV